MVILFATLLASAHAAAQDGFRIDRFRPPPTGEDGLGLQYARTLGHLVPSVGLVLDYAHAPLVAHTTGGESGDIVAHRFLAHVTGALGVSDFLELHVRVPVAFTGSDQPTIGGLYYPSPDVVAIGDGAVGGTVSFLSEGRQGFSLALAIEAMIPWGTSTSYASDTEFSGRGQVLATYVLPQLTIAFMVGGLYRPERHISVAHAGSELEYGASFLLNAIPSAFDLFVELIGAVSLPDGQTHPSPLEGMLGTRIHVGDGFAIEGGVGAGFSQAAGVPDARAILGLRWTQPPPAIGDTDGDGLRDPDDACPSQAEDVDGWEDSDGCIDPDDDNDGWMDEDDACPRQEEDRDGYADTDGCPDPDDDGDGVADADDHCPRAPGESFHQGCPQLITVTTERITLTWPIEFAPGSAVVPVSAGGALLEMAHTFAVDDTLAAWRISVRAVPAGRRDDGVALAEQRAIAIAAALTGLGVDANRLDTGTLPAGPGDAIEITSLGATVHPRPPPPRPAAVERPEAPHP